MFRVQKLDALHQVCRASGLNLLFNILKRITSISWAVCRFSSCSFQPLWATSGHHFLWYLQHNTTKPSSKIKLTRGPQILTSNIHAPAQNRSGTHWRYFLAFQKSLCLSFCACIKLLLSICLSCQYIIRDKQDSMMPQYFLSRLFMHSSKQG